MPTGIIECVITLVVEAFAKCLDLAQRLLQVVRGGIGELLKLGIRPFELLSVAAQGELVAFAIGDISEGHHRTDRLVLRIDR